MYPAAVPQVQSYNVNFFAIRSLLAMPGGRPHGSPAFDAEALALAREFTPPVVSFHLGLPSEEQLRRFGGGEAGCIPLQTTVEKALWLESRGVDAIIAQVWKPAPSSVAFLPPDLPDCRRTMRHLSPTGPATSS